MTSRIHKTRVYSILATKTGITVLVRNLYVLNRFLLYLDREGIEYKVEESRKSQYKVRIDSDDRRTLLLAVLYINTAYFDFLAHLRGRERAGAVSRTV